MSTIIGWKSRAMQKTRSTSSLASNCLNVVLMRSSCSWGRIGWTRGGIGRVFGRLQHPFGCLPPRHSHLDTPLGGERSHVNDPRIEQIFGIDERLVGRAASGRNGLAKLGRGFHVVDAAADDALAGQNAAV